MLVLSNSAVIARPVNFAWQDDPNTLLCSGVLTDVTGLATCVINPSSPVLSPGRAYVATFSGMFSSAVAVDATQFSSGVRLCLPHPSALFVLCCAAIVNEFLLSSGASNTVVTTGATSTLQTPVAGPASIGYDWTVFGILNRVHADGGVYPPAGSAVKFTITRPDGQQTVINGTKRPSFICFSPALFIHLLTDIFVFVCVSCRCHRSDHPEHRAGREWRRYRVSDHQRRCGPHHCARFVHDRRRHLHRSHGVRW